MTGGVVMSKSRTCKFCGEMIDADAKVCEHCDSVLIQTAKPPAGNVPPPPPPPPPKPHSFNAQAKTRPIPPPPPPANSGAVKTDDHDLSPTLKKRSSSTITLVLILLFVIIGISAVLFFMFPSPDDLDDISSTVPVGSTTDQEDQQQTSTDLTQPEDIQVVMIDYQGISFMYDNSLAASVDISIEDASEEDSMILYPRHVIFTLNDPTGSGDIFLNGYLSVYPTAAFRLIDSEAGRVIDDLSTMLASRTIIINDRSLPYLPFPNAGQLFQSNIKIIDFKNGEGIRFITQHVQDLSPIVSEGLEYTFQGLTADERFYVSLNVPVSHPGVAKTWEDFFTDVDYNDFSDNFNAYLERDLEILNNSHDSDFEPSIELLDQLVESILVDNPDFF
jgi:hypothetical protein